VVTNDIPGGEMRTRADSMAVRGDDDLEAQGSRGSDGGVDAKISGQSGYQHPRPAQRLELGSQGRVEERVVQGLADNAVPRIALNRAQNRPPRRAWLERFPWSAIVLDKNDLTAAVPDTPGQAIDALNHGSQIVLVSAQKKGLLHIDDQKNIH
jgi:hypothetical protein